MVVFPSIQRKAQTELDEVVGRGQLSRFADSARLPYIHAIVKETLRWRPVVPMALPHRVTDTVVTISQRVPFASRMCGKYRECHTVSKVLTIRCRAINHDPDVYGADAHEFNPARHLDGEGKIKPALADTKEESHGKIFQFDGDNKLMNCGIQYRMDSVVEFALAGETLFGI